MSDAVRSAAVPRGTPKVLVPGAARPAGPGRFVRRGVLRARRAAWRGVTSLRPVTLGVYAFVQAAVVARLAHGWTRPPAPQPGDHAWWHGGGPGGHAGGHSGGHGDGADGPVLYLALAAAAVYLLLPLLALAAHTVRRLGGGTWAFAVAAGVAGAVVAVPVTALAAALTPGSAAAPWTAALGHAPAALRACVLTGLVLAVACGVPSSARHRANRPQKLVEKRP